MERVFTFLVPIAIGVVFVILVAGIYTLFRGGEVARSHSNRLMRLRVLAQFVAVIVLMGALWLRVRTGG